ncbi:hypothetical protein [Burkholderia lata]|uniref:hypothetical protein n=1 Tax=Burkholderia lata (strain ATCC 17760 / DSM 23089 / LMG 22485 / NCIMB 9086 / R18194 / 383) TaxID=482957 RepID=UPI001582D6CA|nr:hypothetical protein [Burkholderia lata]
MLADLLLFFPVRRRKSSSIFFSWLFLRGRISQPNCITRYCALERVKSADRIAVASKTPEHDEVP